MTSTSVTLAESGIADAINDGGPYESARNKMFARIYQHSLKLEDARAQAAYGQHSSAGKVLEIHQELPGRIHVVLIRQRVGFRAARKEA
jgi:hypothetical protein